MSADEQAAARLSALLESIDDAVITTDLDGRITSWSEGATRLYGFTEAEAVGDSIEVIFPSYRRQEEPQILAAARRGEGMRDVDAVRCRKDGSHVPISLTVTPIRNETGTIIGTLRVARDLSGRDRAVRAARRLAAIVESSEDAIAGKDLNGIVTSWNRAAERMFGYTAEEMIGRSIRLLIPDDRQAEEDAVLASIRSGRKIDHFETIRRRKDGSLVPISLTVSPVVDANGRVIGASKIARDISDRKRDELERAQLLGVAEQNAAITERLNSVGAIVASGLDRTKIVQAVTDAGTELTTADFGAFFYNVVDERAESYPPYTISGVPPEMFGKFPLPRNTAIFEHTFNGRGAVRCEDITADPRYGDNAQFFGVPPGHLPVRSYLAVPVRSRSGEVLGGLFFGHSEVGVFQAQHERLANGLASWAAVALENARLYADVQQASRLKDDFLATLSHELRTPLNAILGYARMIRRGIISPDRHGKAVETIERNASALTQIVEDILDVSRIISGKLRLNVQPVMLTDIVRHAVDATKPAADAKGIHLEVAAAGDVRLVSGDPDRLQQVVWNLLSNAVKFTPQGGRVAVRVEQSDDYIDLYVSDTGIGIRPEFLAYIFERFRQADASTTRERGGLGLGLSIARQLTELHGGTIDAHSGGIGRGAEFHVRLPAFVPSAAGKRLRSENPINVGRRELQLPDLRGIRVLAVDDDADALNMVKEILEAAGAQVIVADSAVAALDAVEIAPPDVLVGDLGMPRMDGFEMISRIRHSTSAAVRAIPAAAVTAYARSEDRVKALKSGFQAHLAKPIDPTELTSAVAALAQQRPLKPTT